MDAVELGYLVDVPRLMGSEGFGKARVTVNEAEVVGAGAGACESSSRVSFLVNSCTTFLRQKDVTSTVNDSESALWDKIPETELHKHDNQLPGIQAEDSFEQVQSRGSNCPSSTSRSEFVQVQRKAGKVSRSSSGGSKRPRLAQLEDNMSSAGVDDIKDISDIVGPCPTKCNSLEKSQIAKQKNNCSGRRGDKRNFKVPMKAKYDTFSMKAGLASFSSAAGGNNLLGLYGLKSDARDVTNHVDELPLKDLLDGSLYDCPSLTKDKDKKAANRNENFLLSVRKACTILPLSKPVQSPNFAEMDGSSCKKLLVSPPSSVCLVSSGVNSDQKDSSATNLSSCDKESCSKPGTPVNPLDFPLYQPKDIFERLALPPPKDLEALLLEATKPSASSRTNSDIRSGKLISRRPSLPPFPWSHTFNGHCRTNSDAVKLLTSRTTCQGQWARIESSAISHGTPTDCFTNLELLTYDQSLVPPSTSVSIPWHEWGSSLTSSKASLVNLDIAFLLNVASGVGPKNQVLVDAICSEHCPKVLAAAQTLCDMATQSLRRNPNGSIKWPKKPSQKAMKARKSKSFEKPEELSSTGQISSPNRSVRDLIAEGRHSSVDVPRQSCMMPPPAPGPSRISDKASNKDSSEFFALCKAFDEAIEISSSRQCAQIFLAGLYQVLY
ncbi:hypothetical protein JRO89_XS13G0155500 [Xanthoceras sorbifolium]|uniref:Uncharacterized protein n=1 Tax=Xanthoceras sorbifolium TaxID=99658 RepID=A0ABQ8H8F8_9ROSI|nr:hypothetical protein JRO89_XS13G0155500 [Xanthoceras sorbifolium]